MTLVQNYFDKKEDWYVLRLNPDMDLYISAVSQLGQHIRIKGELLTEANLSIAGFGAGATKQSFSDHETILRKMLQVAQKKNKKILVAIDEASNTEKIKMFAHTYQAFIGEKLPIFLLMNALPENFSSLASSKNGTFLRRLPRIKLEELNQYLIVEKYQDIFKVPEDKAIELSKVVRGYAYAFQLLGALLWEKGTREINADVLKNLDAMLYEGCYKPIWDHLTEKEQQILVGIARSSDGTVTEIREILNLQSNQFSPYRDHLKEYGLIDKVILPNLEEKK